jgi:hypothetical protein
MAIWRFHSARLSPMGLTLAGATFVLLARALAACAGPTQGVGVATGAGGSGGGSGGVGAGGGDAGPDAPPDAPPDAALVCDPKGPPQCDGTAAVKTCRSDGSGFDSTACTTGPCQSGQCQQLCPPGTVFSLGQCDDIRCPDELPSSTPTGVGLPTNTNAWPRFRHDNRNSGWTRAKVAASPTLLWHSLVNGWGRGAVVDPSGLVYANMTSWDQTMALFSTVNPAGTIQWTSMLGQDHTATIPSVPAVRNDGTAYASTALTALATDPGPGLLAAVAPGGSPTWTFKTPATSDGAPVVAHDGTIVYPSNDESVYALDANGNLRWKTNSSSGPGLVHGGVAESCDGHIIVGGSNGWAALDITTGQNLWLVKANAQFASPVVTADGTMYGLDNSGIGWAIDKTGTVIWSKPLMKGPLSSASIAKLGKLLIAAPGASSLPLLGVDADTGTILWSFPGGGQGFFGGPIIDGNLHIYVNDFGAVRALDMTGQQLWMIPIQGGFSELAIAPGGTIYVFEYAFAPGSNTMGGYLDAIK